jgi:hypothetical protein
MVTLLPSFAALGLALLVAARDTERWWHDRKQRGHALKAAEPRVTCAYCGEAADQRHPVVSIGCGNVHVAHLLPSTFLPAGRRRPLL